MKKLIMLIVMLGFCCRAFVLNAQVQEEPVFPTCSDGYTLIGEFEGDLRADIASDDATDTYTFNVDGLHCDADLVDLIVDGFAKEGHPENPNCTPTGGSDDQCTQTQNFENFEVDVDGGVVFGTYTDNQGAGGVENAWFPAGPWNTTVLAGSNHELNFTHTEYPSLDPESVGYKVSLCAKCEEEGGGEGCTPGYWKNHLDAWPTGYSSGQLFSEAFGCEISIMGKNGSGRGKPILIIDPTLLDALKANGGGCSALARHAVAALLNEASDDVSYGPIPQGVIAAVCGAIDPVSGECDEDIKDDLAIENERGCPF